MMRFLIRFIFFPFYKRDQVMVSSHQGSSLFRENIRRQFSKNRLGVFSLRFLYGFIMVALLADFLANEKPLIAKYQGSLYFPVLRSYAVNLGWAQWQKDFQHVEWAKIPYEWSVFPPVPYLPQNMDRNNVHSVSPFGEQNLLSLRWRHWFGTDELGRDILSGMIHGTRIALTVGLVSMGIASLFGIFIGAVSGYFGDERLKLSRASVFMNVLFFVMGFFWAFIARSYEISDALAISFGKFFLQILFSVLLMVGALLAGNLLALPLKLIPILKKRIAIPVDLIISRFIEVMISVPVLFLIISISAIVAHPSIYIVMTIIGLTSWTGIARFIRAEMLRIRSLEYIEAARALGYSEGRVILRHAIPNALSPVLITIAFGIAAAIMIESTLSFLGVGVSPETVTWGSLLAEARQSPSAWWLAILPGTAIFVTVTIFNLIGEALTDALDPKLKK
ncbi:MAG: ABC transporter permease [Bacteroidetes bacterium]|nr:MAG: ABC transporter permease [Bacteroidota bacterium]